MNSEHPTDGVARLSPALTGCVVVALYALAIGWFLQPNILGDDAAITFRYVERLASGHGFTYNDHEHVLGASNPLYVLLLFLLTRFGLDVETAARVFALTLFPIVAALVTFGTARLAQSSVAGMLAGAVLATDDFFRYQALGGMESGLAVFLGLLTIIFVLEEMDVAAGIVLGLAVWNKLDAGALAVAVTVAWIVVKRQLPLKVGLISILVVLPWMVFAGWYYGSPIPHSLITKVRGVPQFNHAWVAAFLVSNNRFCFLVLAAASLAFLPGSKRARLAAVALFAWFLVHAATFSLLNLGDYFPWYLTVLIPPLIMLSFCFVGRILAHRPAEIPRLGLAAIGGILLCFGTVPFVRATYADVAGGDPIKSWEAFDSDRRMAGLFLDQHANADEVVSSGYGWVAFEARRPFNDESGLNSQKMIEPVAYRVSNGVPWSTDSHPPVAPAGFVPLAVFNLASDLFPGYSWFTVFGRPDSHIAVTGPRYLQYRLFELDPPQPWSESIGLKNVQISGVNMFAHPPSGATFAVENRRQPVRLVFVPSFAADVPRDKTDGVTFAVWSEGALQYQQHKRPADAADPIVLPLDQSRSREKISWSFVTDPGPKGDLDFDWAVWRDVKIVVGDSVLDLNTLHNRRLLAAWTRHNPGGLPPVGR